MSATVLAKASEETRTLAEETRLATRAADFEELFCELVEESGRALEEGYLEWCAVLQGYLLPKRKTLPFCPIWVPPLLIHQESEKAHSRTTQGKAWGVLQVGIGLLACHKDE